MRFFFRGGSSFSGEEGNWSCLYGPSDQSALFSKTERALPAVAKVASGRRKRVTGPRGRGDDT